MTWLLRSGDVLATAEVADGFWGRSKGLIGRADYDGVLVLTHTRSVHSFGMRFPLDVALCLGDENSDLVVRRIIRLPQWRITIPRVGCRTVVEAEAGAFERWGLQVGDVLKLR
jgi:uncharacterized membrane protein (UPF0127 family)